MEDAIEQIVAFFKHAAQGLEEKKQILYLLGPVGGGKSSIAERLKAVMEKQSDLRDQGLAGQRIAARPLPARALRRRAGDGLRHSAPLSDRHHVAVGGQAPRGIRRRPVALPRRAHPAVGAAPGGDHQDRAGRREQPGHLVARRQGRHPPARAPVAERSGRLQLLRRPVPRQPGPARVRRDVQGADQDAAPAADGDAGRQLQGHRRLLGDPVQRRHRRALERVRVAQLPQQQEQRGVPRPHLHRQGAVLRARVRGSEDLREAPHQLVARRRAVRAGHARDDGAVLGADAPEGAREFEHLFEDARLRRRDAEGRRSQGQDAAGVPRLRRHGRRHDGHVDALRLQDPVGGVQPRPDRDRRQSGAPHVRARAAARARGPARRDAPPLRRARQGLPRAALRGVHRQGDPDRVPRVVCRVRPEHLRPLRHVRRLLDPGRGLSRSRDRRELRPRRAQHRAREDREAGGHRQSEGFPQRDRQLRAARARPQQRPQSRRGAATRSCAR